MAHIRKKHADQPPQTDANVAVAAKSRERTTYDIVTEAGWYALKPFFNVMDCNLKTDKYFSPMNLNDDILLKWQGLPAKFGQKGDGKYGIVRCNPNDSDGGEVGLDRLSKGDFKLHREYGISQKENPEEEDAKVERQFIYYRGELASPYFTGFGASARQASSTVFSEALGVNTERVDYPVGAILLTIDIDFHEDQYPMGTVNDAEAVFQWLHGTYFPDAYWERSTHGNGFHLYIKTAYSMHDPSKVVYNLVCLTNKLKLFLSDLDSLRIHKGFNAKIDRRVFGLPSLWVKKKLLIKRSYCMKLPYFFTLEDVRQFHFSPVYLIDHFQVREPIPQPTQARERQGNDKGIITLPPAGSSETDLFDSDGSVWESVGEARYVSFYRRRTFEEQIEELRLLKASTDPKADFARLNGFYKLLCRRERELVSPEEANEQYVVLGLNKTDNSERRLKTFQGMKHFYEGKFDSAMTSGIDMEGWEKARLGLERLVEGIVVPFKKYKTKGKRPQIKAVCPAQMAGVLFVLAKLAEDNTDPFFSHDTLRGFMREAASITLCMNAISPCLLALQKRGLIRIIKKGRLDMKAGQSEGTMFTVSTEVKEIVAGTAWSNAA